MATEPNYGSGCGWAERVGAPSGPMPAVMEGGGHFVLKSACLKKRDKVAPTGAAQEGVPAAIKDVSFRVGAVIPSVEAPPTSLLLNSGPMHRDGIQPAKIDLNLNSICPCAFARIVRMKQKIQLIEPVPRPVPGKAFVSAGRNGRSLPFGDALRIQSAHYWLELGQPDEALRELEALPSRAWLHPLTVRVRLAALRFAARILCH
jgi:hypothetical protein